MIEFDPNGNVTSTPGWKAGAAYAGIKTYGEGKLDIAILAADYPCVAAATFTRNRLRSAAIDVNVAHLENGRVRGLVVNAGVANSSTGEQGYRDAERMCELAGAKLGIPADELLVGSTGVIGHYLPMEKIESGIAAIQLSEDGGEPFGRAIMTTDLVPKFGAVRFGPYTMGGNCKGSGMIHPNMATMLAYITTDAPVDLAFLRYELREAVDRSFNLVSVDGDTSPSDTCAVFARDPQGGEAIDANHELASAFREALNAITRHLAREIARDGEGATKVIEATVTGAANDADARALVRLLTTSYLLKSAIHGADPNWGRITAVIGRSGVAFEEADVTIDLCGVRVFEHQRPTEFSAEAVSELMKRDEVPMVVSLGSGPGIATGWGCDLSAEYVHINADYHT